MTHRGFAGGVCPHESDNDAPTNLDLHAEQLSKHVFQLQRPSEDDDAKNKTKKY
jgi:hypothetical protein